MKESDFICHIEKARLKIIGAANTIFFYDDLHLNFLRRTINIINILLEKHNNESLTNEEVLFLNTIISITQQPKSSINNTAIFIANRVKKHLEENNSLANEIDPPYNNFLGYLAHTISSHMNKSKAIDLYEFKNSGITSEADGFIYRVSLKPHKEDHTYQIESDMSFTGKSQDMFGKNSWQNDFGDGDEGGIC